jgi:signal transduction histidine kinase
MTETVSSSRRALIVANDFDVVMRVRQAVGGGSVALQTAYSHQDALYAAQNTEFDVVFVPAGMQSRETGEATPLALAQQKPDIPIIMLKSEYDPSPKNLLSNVHVTTLAEAEIAQTLATVLRLSTRSLQPAEGSASEESDPTPAEEIGALLNLSRSLAEVLDTSEVLNRIVEAARRLTHAEEGMILLPDEEGGQLFLRARVGIDIEIARNFRVKTEDTLAGRVYASGQPLLLGGQGPQKVKTEYLVNALLYVPILYKGQCMGVLGVNNKQSDEVFSARHKELLQNLASFAAIALENARSHEETVERTRELQTLVEASQVLNTSLTLGTTPTAICDQLVRVGDVNLVEIYDWDQYGERLRLLARSIRTLWPAGQGPVIELKARPLINRAVLSGRPVRMWRDDDELDAKEAVALNRAGLMAITVLPIRGGDQPVGAVLLCFVDEPRHAPTTETYARIQQMTLELLVSMPDTSGTRSSPPLRVLEEMNRLTGADWCEVALLSPDQQLLNVQLAAGKAVWMDAPQPVLDLRQAADLVEAMRSGRPITRHMDTQLITPSIRALLERTNSQTVLGLPMMQRGQPQGLVLFGDARRGRVFTARDIDLGRAIVSQAATALENARLFYHLERSLADLKQAQERLVQTARLSAMGELAAAVAHQINNPLTTIMVDSEMLLLDVEATSPMYKSLQSIHRAGKRASGVARRLLAISRPSDPESPPARIDVVDTIDGVLSLVKSHIERDHIRLIWNPPTEPLPPVWAVPGQLDDIWLNLLMNAHDALAGRPDARIGIAVKCAEEGPLMVRIWDNGPGIPNGIIEEIFKPFFTTKPVGEGTGLGLHICRQTAERVSGSINVKSDPQVGTEFIVQLPVKRGRTDV